MTDPMFAPRQWKTWEQREDERQFEALGTFAEQVAQARRQAIVTGVCLVCAGEIVNSVCSTCEAEYEALPFDDHSEITS